MIRDQLFQLKRPSLRIVERTLTQIHILLPREGRNRAFEPFFLRCLEKWQSWRSRRQHFDLLRRRRHRGDDGDDAADCPQKSGRTERPLKLQVPMLCGGARAPRRTESQKAKVHLAFWPTLQFGTCNLAKYRWQTFRSTYVTHISMLVKTWGVWLNLRRCNANMLDSSALHPARYKLT